MATISFLAMGLLCLLVAGLYATIGLGGGTGYLAVMTLFSVPQAILPSTALALNLVVTGSATLRYGYMGRLNWRLFLPFLFPAVPCAFMGGLLEGDQSVFLGALAVTLVVVAIAMLRSAGRKPGQVVEPKRKVLWAVGIPCGALFGLVSGFTGVGGGVFLGPTLLLLRWVDPKKMAPMNSAFILLLSASGLAAHGLRGVVDFVFLAPLALAVLVGGWIGAHIGETRLSAATLQRIFAAVILIAALKASWSLFG